MKIIIVLTMVYGLWTMDSFAADKTWTGAGDQENWSDDDNWFPNAAPTTVDSVLIDEEDVSANCSQTFEAQSVTVGGSQGSTLSVDNFVYGEIRPPGSSGTAVLNSKDGKIILKGAAGIVTLGGQYKSSKETVVPESNFMFWVE